MVETSSNASSDTLSVILDVPGYHVVRPIPYHVESIGEQIVAVDDEFDRYGAGTSLVQAKLELACQLSDYFNTLKEDCEILAKTAMRDYRRMAHFVSWIAE